MRPSRSQSCSRSWFRGCCSSAYPFWKEFSDGLIESRRKTTGFSRGGGGQLPELRIVGPAEPCDGRDGEWPVEWDGGHGLLVVRRLKTELKEIR